MNVKSFEDAKSEILSINGIKNEASELPDIGIEVTPDLYLERMEPIQKGKEFVDAVKKNHGKNFFVIGDYDCDGIFATTIMAMALSVCGEKSAFTAPDRFVDGYGMKKCHIDEAIKNGASVIITVDNGITALEEIDYAKSKGLTVIVTDHHLAQGENHADIIIDPWVNSDSYKDISGGTVALKLAKCLWDEFHYDRSVLIDFMILAGITSFSDVMSMKGENRLLAKATMRKMNEDVKKKDSFSKRIADMLDYYVPGKNSYDDLGLDGNYRNFDRDNIDFYFVPMINAANRVVGNVNSLIYDVMSLFSGEYSGYPHVYRDLNKERKYMRSDMLSLHVEDHSCHAVVEVIRPSSFEGNYSGISGLVASAIVDSEGKPALIGLPCEEGMAKFSGRSVRGYDLYEALSKIKSSHPEITLEFGGHAEALGMKCSESDVGLIKSLLSDDFEKSGITASKDAELYEAGKDVEAIKKAFDEYEPYGPDFSFPKFVVEGNLTGYDMRERTFVVDSLNAPIRTYSKKDFDRVVMKASSEGSKAVKVVYSFMHDSDGCVCLKAERFLK